MNNTTKAKASKYTKKIKAEAATKKRTYSKRRKFIKIGFKESDIGVGVPLDFMRAVNQMANLKVHVLNNVQLLDSVGKSYRESSYQVVSETRKELKKEWGISYSKTLVGTPNHELFNFADLQTLGTRKGKKRNKAPRKVTIKNDDQFLFIVNDTNFSGSENYLKVNTNLALDKYIDLNYIGGKNITYRGGKQGVASVSVKGRVFARNIFPITLKTGHKIYMYRIKTSPRSPKVWTDVETLKTKGIYKPNTSFGHPKYEGPLQGSVESQLSCYAYVETGEEFKNIFEHHNGPVYSVAFKNAFENSLNTKIYHAMKNNTLRYNIVQNFRKRSKRK